MYHHIRGRVSEKSSNQVILDVGGVGYKITVSPQTALQLPAVDAEASVFTHLIVRDDELALVGFFTREERSLFLNLLRVTSIGPTLAVQIIGQSSISRLVQAIVTGDSLFLQSLKGVGKKTSERIVLELKDRLKGMVQFESLRGEGSRGVPDDAYKALLVLGLSPEDARARLEKVAVSVAAQGAGETATDEWIRRALQRG